MFKLNDLSARKDAPAQKTHESPTEGIARQQRMRGNVLDVCIVLVMGVLLFWGISTQFPNQYNDATRYQCYANVFWKGTPGLASLPAKQCAFLAANSSSALAQRLKARGFPESIIRLVTSQSTTQPFHALPPEYPLLTIVPFTLGLVAPQQDYQIAIALWMALVAGIIYFLLKAYRSRGAAIAFAFYLVVGCWATAEGRFDLIPSALTLGAVLLAARAKWQWAFALLALATLLKLYPIFLVVPFLIAQQSQLKGKFISWERWSALGLFIALCVGVTILSLLLNVADTLSPLSYFLNRPTQIESLQASLLWLGSHFGYPIQYVFTYQSFNMLSPLASKVSLLGTFCLAVGLLYTFWLQWRGKIDIYVASLLTLLIVLVTGKVFSPQYLMWVLPLVAYVGRSNWKWLLSWGAICALTTLIFPYLYDNYLVTPDYVVIAVRNGILLLVVLALLVYVSRGTPGSAEPQDDAVSAKEVKTRKIL